MPYVVIDGASIYDHLRNPKFHLVAFSNDSGEGLKVRIEGEYSGLVDFNGFQLDDEVAKIFGADRPFTVFLRPDNYIGFISSKPSFVKLENYLQGGHHVP